MKLIASILALMMVFGATLSAEARSKKRHGRTWSDDSRSYSYRRSSTIAPNGACWRDTGRPLDSLNLNHQCDREEFWARMNDRGGNSRN